MEPQPHPILQHPAANNSLAWLAVRNRDYIALTKLTVDHGRAATEPIIPVTGEPKTPLTAACLSGDTLAVSILLSAGADPNLRADGYSIASPMTWAIKAKSLGCIRQLLDAGAKHNPASEDWADTAVTHTNTEISDLPGDASSILRTLLNHGVPPTPRTFCRAIEKGRHTAVKHLIAAGADIHATRLINSTSPIECCLQLPGSIRNQYTTGPQMLRILLDAGYNPNAPCSRPAPSPPCSSPSRPEPTGRSPRSCAPAPILPR